MSAAGSTAQAIACRPIGHVRSRFTDPVGMPIQTAGAADEAGSVELLPEFEAGLRDIEGFDYLIDHGTWARLHRRATCACPC